MSAISGYLATLDQSTNDLVGEWQETIFIRHANGDSSGQFLAALISRMPSDNCPNAEYNWFEKDPTPRQFRTSAAVGNTTSEVLPVTDWEDTTADVYANFGVGAILEVGETGEYLRVSANATSNNIAVTRGFAGTTAYNIPDNATIVLITVGAVEGADAPARAVYTLPEDIKNYCQVYNRSVEITWLNKTQALRSAQDGSLTDQHLDALDQVAKDLEFSFFKGRKSKTSIGGARAYYTGGIEEAVNIYGQPENVIDGGTTGVSLEVFLTWIGSCLTYGSPATKVIFAGRKAFAALSIYANSASAGFRIANESTALGMQIVDVITPFGTVSMINHPLFTEVPSYATKMFLVDLSALTTQINTPLDLLEDQAPRGAHKEAYQFYGVQGLQLKNAKAFGVATGISSISTD